MAQTNILAVSLACKLEIEGGQTYAKRLEDRCWVRYVHIEILLAHTPKLHVNVIVVVLVYQLKVLYARLVHTSIEIEHECLYLYETQKTDIKTVTKFTYIRSTLVAC